VKLCEAPAEDSAFLSSPLFATSFLPSLRLYKSIEKTTARNNSKQTIRETTTKQHTSLSLLLTLDYTYRKERKKEK